MIWISIKSYQGHNETAWPSMETIGKRITMETGEPMKRQQVARGIKVLVDEGFLVVNGRKSYSCIMPPNATPSLQKATGGLQKRQLPVDRTQLPVDKKGNSQLTKGNPQLHSNKREQLKETIKETRKGESPSAFPTPTVEEAQRYFEAIAFTSGVAIDADAEGKKFWSHYESLGWYSGATPILKWKLKADQWLSRIRSGKFDAARPLSANGGVSKTDEIHFQLNYPNLSDYPEHLREEAMRRFPRLRKQEVR
jgi:hypothetical protein